MGITPSQELKNAGASEVAGVTAPDQPHLAGQLHPAQQEQVPANINARLPADILEHIFSLVPARLRLRLQEVCRSWRQHAGAPGAVPAELRSCMPPQHASVLTVNAAWSRLEVLLFHTNFLQEPGFEKFGARGGVWMTSGIIHHHGNLMVERPAGQARDLGGKLDSLTPFMPGRRAHSTVAQQSPGVLALSNWIAVVFQHVHLSDVALPPIKQWKGPTSACTAQLAVAECAASPALAFSVWVGAQGDCGMFAKVTLVLTPSAAPQIPCGQVGQNGFGYSHPSPSAVFWQSPILKAANLPSSTQSPAPYAQNEASVRRGSWSRVAHVFEVVPQDTREVTVILEGSDTAFWSGHYGPRFYAPELHFVPRDQIEAFLSVPGSFGRNPFPDAQPE